MVCLLFVCDQCSKAFQEESRLENHQGSTEHKGILKCELCGIFFNPAKSLNEQQEQTENNNAVAVCKFRAALLEVQILRKSLSHCLVEMATMRTVQFEKLLKIKAANISWRLRSTLNVKLQILLGYDVARLIGKFLP